MDEVENKNSNEEFVTPVTETNQDPVSTEKETQDAQPATADDTSWIKKLRRDREDAIRENRMKDDLIKQLVSQSQFQQLQPQQEEEDFIESIRKEEYVPGEKVAKGLRNIEAKFEKKLQEMQQSYQQTAAVSKWDKLKEKHPDLEDVVNLDTLQLVKQHNPDLAAAWKNLDDYTIAVQAYPYLKYSGLLGETKSSKRVNETERKLEQNKKTVPSPQVFEKRPMAQAFDYARLSEDQKRELNREMQHYASHSGGY